MIIEWCVSVSAEAYDATLPPEAILVRKGMRSHEFMAGQRGWGRG
jgi:hypothetical protein